jgi:hypothetical protein
MIEPSAVLREFKITLLRFTLHALEPVGLPSFSGSTFRGAFGAEFRRIACLPLCHDPGDCMIAAQCAYARIFEAKPVKEGYTPAGDGGLPRPFVIHPPVGGRGIEPGQRFTFHLALVGSAADYVPYFILAWRELGRAGLGRGRGRFKLETVESCASIDERPNDAAVSHGDHAATNYQGRGTQNPTRLIYSSKDELVRNSLEHLTAERLLSLHPTLGSTNGGSSPPGAGVGEDAHTPDIPSDIASGAPALEGRLSIEMVTPLRLKSKGEFLRSDLPFAALAGALLRRLETLSFFYGPGSLGLDYRALMEKARQARTLSSNLRWVEWERYSSRQDRRVPWGGTLGRAEYVGDVRAFMPFLALGEILGVGNNCVFGLGRLRVSAAVARGPQT